MELADIRKDYRLKAMNEREINPNPMQQFQLWLICADMLKPYTIVWQHAE
jgi:pyridoxine/pyridoxamine 5'-phosphate oxidase